MWITPIKDRTADDITNRTAKGYFNISDLQRIVGNTAHVAGLISQYKGVNIDVSGLPEMTVYSIPTPAQINALVAVIEQIRITLGITHIGQLRANWGGGYVSAPNYLTINSWEAVLYAGYYYFDDLSRYIYAGVAIAGADRTTQSDYRDGG